MLEERQLRFRVQGDSIRVLHCFSLMDHPGLAACFGPDLVAAAEARAAVARSVKEKDLSVLELVSHKQTQRHGLSATAGRAPTMLLRLAAC